MARFVNITNTDGVVIKVHPDQVASLYPLVSNPANTVVSMSDGTTFVSSSTKEAIAVLLMGGGVYYANSGDSTVTATADAATAGRVWLINTSASKNLIVRSMIFGWAPVSATGFLTSPRFTVERITFTGTPSGATITPAKRDSTDSSAVASLRSASTGMTITGDGTITAWRVGPVISAGGSPTNAISPTTEQIWFPRDEWDAIVIRQNEGIVIRQASVGSTADTRVVDVDFIWEEIVP